MSVAGHLLGILALLTLVATACGPQAAPTATPATPPAASPAPTTTRVVTATATPAPALVATPTPGARPTPTVAAGRVSATGKMTIAVASLLGQPRDPMRYRGWTEMAIVEPLSDSLVAYDTELKLVPSVASAWSVSSDGQAWEFTIRPGVKFHDGSVLKPEDAIFSIQRYQKPELGTGRASFFQERIQTMEAREGKAIVKMKVPYPLFVDDLFGTRIISQSYVGKVGEDGYVQKPVTTGPFRFVNMAMGDFHQMEAFEDYWAGPPSVKSVTFAIVPEPATRYAMLATGEADIVDGMLGPFSLNIASNRQLRLVSVPYAGTAEINFPATVKDPPHPLKDKRVRLALSLAIDRQAMAERLFYGYAKAGIGTWFPHSLNADTALQPHPYDPERAKQLLKEAGYPDGFDITFETYYTGAAPMVPEQTEAVAAYWQKIGVKTTMTRVESGIHAARMRDKTVSTDVNVIGVPGSYVTDFLKMEHQYTTRGYYSYVWVPEIDALFREAAVTMDPKRRDEIGKAMTRTMFENVYILVPLYVNANFGVGPRVADWTPRKGDTTISNLRNIRLK